MNERTAKSGVKRGRTGKGISDLGALPVEPIKDSLERGVAESAADPSLFVVLISGAQSLRSVIESVTERLVNALKGIAACHKNLCQQCK